MDIDNAKNLGMHWAAIRDNQAMVVIPMTVPKDVDFALFRERVLATLELLGDVKSGEVFDDYGERCFVPRLNHANRSKNPRPKKQLPIYQPSEVFHTGGYL